MSEVVVAVICRLIFMTVLPLSCVGAAAYAALKLAMPVGNIGILCLGIGLVMFLARFLDVYLQERGGRFKRFRIWVVRPYQDAPAWRERSSSVRLMTHVAYYLGVVLSVLMWSSVMNAVL
jgi:hypothetical protein